MCVCVLLLLNPMSTCEAGRSLPYKYIKLIGYSRQICLRPFTMSKLCTYGLKTCATPFHLTQFTCKKCNLDSIYFGSYNRVIITTHVLPFYRHITYCVLYIISTLHVIVYNILFIILLIHLHSMSWQHTKSV